MRLKHGELEELRSNFAAWIAAKKSEGSGPRMSYKHATRMGIYRLHRGDNLRTAVSHLTRYFDSYGLRSAARRSEAEGNIAEYFEWMQQETAAFIATKTRIQFAANDDVSIGGELPRIDLLAADDGYRAILLGESDAAWRSQLRMPIIQRAVSQILKRPEELVSVGVQELDGSSLQATTYSKRHINAAVAELADLAAKARRGLST